MINVKRIDCPDVLKIGLDPVSIGQKETEEIIVFFRDAEKGGTKYKKAGKQAYSDKTVRELLRKMFYGKCAYCESRITAIYSGDIDHFRPKSTYQWLAADWENLLFACPFCNQTYTHEIRLDGTIKEVVQGKLDQFPLLSEAYRLTMTQGELFLTNATAYKTSLEREETRRLLLRPCTDKAIERFFKYNDQGLILKGDGLNIIEQRKADESIRVYALQRLGLVQAREAKVIQIRAQLKRVENAIHNLNIYYDRSETDRIWYEGVLRKEIAILNRFKDPDQEYAGLARYIIRKYFDYFSAKNL